MNNVLTSLRQEGYQRASDACKELLRATPMFLLSPTAIERNVEVADFSFHSNPDIPS